ncbi:MAG TPA: HAD-IIIC family phosphatase [Nitrospira sp.]|nr:HAD-IIIC family phosphatase [Nitrospira sp.]
MACIGSNYHAVGSSVAMNFLEAYHLVQDFTGGPSQPLRVVLSGTGDPLALYLKAAGARHGVAIDPLFIPFNTLPQYLLGGPDGTPEIFLLLPWDFAPELDWRSGIPLVMDKAVIVEGARATAERIQRRNACVGYLPAVVPPVLTDPDRMREILAILQGIAAGIGAFELPADGFSLTSYLGTGCPLRGASLGTIAIALVEAALRPRHESAKVLVSDLDNVMWRGVVAEDGLEGISFAPQGVGYRHFLYQTLLARLKNEGVLLAAVSRNDPEVALGPFRTGQMVLKEDDFVAIVASYHAKSAQVESLAEKLNLGLDAFVFVDDNEVELTEMGLKLPTVHCERFPARDDQLPGLLDRLNTHFRRLVVTPEDRERTSLYRRRLLGMVPSTAQGADLRAFLEGLEMTLVVHDRSVGDRERAVQLINKTSQFNINGRRVTDAEVARILAAGGRLFTATLTDKNGTHGEILAILIDGNEVVKSLVMSCRVFQRQAEFAFIAWLARGARPPRLFEVAETSRNEPARQFLTDPAFLPPANGRVEFDPTRFLKSHSDIGALIALVEP